MLTFSVATDDAYTHEGVVTRRTDWHRVTLSDEKGVDALSKILTKGCDPFYLLFPQLLIQPSSRVFVEGSLRNRTYKDSTGQDRITTEIHVQRRKGTDAHCRVAPHWSQAEICSLLRNTKPNNDVDLEIN